MAKNLTDKIKAEQEKLEALKQKRAVLDDSIRKSEAALERYRMAEESSQYNVIADAAKGSGISVEALIAALKDGDLLSLQEQMEEARADEAKEDAVEDTAEDTQQETNDEYSDEGSDNSFGGGFGGMF